MRMALCIGAIPIDVITLNYSKRHYKFLLPALSGAIYRSFCKAESKISNVANNNNLHYYLRCQLKAAEWRLL